MPGASLQRAKDASRGYWRWVPGMSRQAGNMPGFESDVFHVRRSRADVFRGYVTTFERFNKTSVCAKNCFAILRFVIANHDRLAAAKWQTGHRVLVDIPFERRSASRLA